MTKDVYNTEFVTLVAIQMSNAKTKTTHEHDRQATRPNPTAIILIL